jgi:succinylglutamic semialdehyde dehydrogenase
VAQGQGRSFIGGKWAAGGGDPFTSTNPYDNDVIWEGTSASEADVGHAVERAAVAARPWAALSVEARAAYLTAFTESVKRHRDGLIDAVARDAGKPLWEAATEVDALVGKLQPSLDAQLLRNTERETAIGSGVSVTRFRPHGVVAVLGPFNFPASMANSHMQPALLAGNAVIVKPSEKTPLVAELVFRCWEEAGLPEGVVSLVQGGPETAQALISDERVAGVYLTGSVGAGQAVSRVAASRSTPPILALEMGGNSPLVVWAPEDATTAVLIAVQSAYVSAGQRCSSARRLIVEEGASDFVEALSASVRQLVVGDPLDSASPYMGPLISRASAERILEEQERLIALGAETIVPVRRQESPGHALLRPGLIDVTGVSGVGDEEVFGPLLKLIRTDDFEDAIRIANDTRFGLASGLVSQSRSLYEQFLTESRAGIVNWNQQLTGAVGVAPFGGVKDSGNFRPGGFLSADYCVYATASLEVARPTVPETLPPGLTL